MKKIISFLILFVFIASSFDSYAQLSGILKNIFSSEKTIIRETATISSKNLSKGTRFFYKNSELVLVKISKESKISEGFKKIIKDYGEDIIDYGSEIITQDSPPSLTESKNSTIDYFKEIEIKKLPPKFYKTLCQKFKKDSLNDKEIQLALTGQKINNISITKEKLFKVYFILCDKFAINALTSLHNYYSGDQINQEKIEKLAIERGVKINSKEQSVKDEESDFWDIFIGFIIIIVLFYFIYKLYKFVKLLIQKLTLLLSKKK